MHAANGHDGPSQMAMTGLRCLSDGGGAHPGNGADEGAEGVVRLVEARPRQGAQQGRRRVVLAGRLHRQPPFPRAHHRGACAAPPPPPISHLVLSCIWIPPVVRLTTSD